MEKNITIGDMDYLVTDEETIHQGDELVFEIKTIRDTDPTFVVGLWEDLLGRPIVKVWKIIKNKIHHDDSYDIGGSE
jgi:hypothetical protein